MSTDDFLGDFATDSPPSYYAPGGSYVLFADLLGFTAFVRSSFQ